MVADKMVRTKWYWQNGTDKMVWTKCYVDKMVLDKMVADKMVRTKWHGQNVKLTKCYQTKWLGQISMDTMLCY